VIEAQYLSEQCEPKGFKMNKADLRPLVLEALRQEPDTQFVAVEHRLRGLAPSYHRHDALKVREILWELLIQGVLAPGFNSSNLDFPFIHVTEYGEKCLEANAILPHDPDRYLERLQQQVEQPLDDIVLTYVRESLLTFLAGHYLAATVMLGVASERCVDLLIEAYLNAITDATRKASFEKKVKRAGRSVKRRFDALRSELLALALPTDLKDALDIHLSGIFTLIRYSRNDAGHPTGRMVDRDTAHANLLMFPQYCTRVCALISHFQTAVV
jgi:hypothetical protein